MKVTYRKPRGKHAGRYLVKCTCGYDFHTGCDCKLEIYDMGNEDNSFFEINGVMDTKEAWLTLFKKIGLLD